MTSFKLTQPVNAFSPIRLTPSGIIIFVKAMQSLKHESAIHVTLLGSITISKLSQCSNALFPIVVTFLGMLMHFNALY